MNPMPSDVLDGEGGGGLKGGGGGGWDPPSSHGPPNGPRRRRAKKFEAYIRLAAKALKGKKFFLAVSLKHWKEKGGWGCPPSSCGARPFHYITANAPAFGPSGSCQPSEVVGREWLVSSDALGGRPRRSTAASAPAGVRGHCSVVG